MLYSGADLIRNSGQQLERLERLNTGDEVVAAQPAKRSEDPPEGETQGALLRFARFVHKEGERKKPPQPPKLQAAASIGGNPYREAEVHQQNLFERGQQLDVYI
jgi:hypothetical protein